MIMGTRNSKWYVTYYREYPIYEPAEGGYYYAGTSNISVHAFNTFRKARRYFRKAAAEFRKYIDMENQILESNIHKNGYILYASKYIGDCEGIIITFGEPPREHGWRPYS